ncbi:MAG: hypothetical protein ACKOAR_08190, partial [Bacteroidota bacterium]
MKRITLSVLLALSVLPSAAQIRQDTIQGLFRSFYFPDRDLLLRTYDDGFTLSPPDQPEPRKRQRPVGWNTMIAWSGFQLIGERLFSINNKNRSVSVVTSDSVRVTDPFPHNKVTINASLFAHNTDYYMFGGYGLWSNRSTLLRLNRYDRWEPVIFEREDGRSEAESFPPPLHHTVFIISGDTGIIYNGYLVDPTDRLHKPTWDGVWMLDIPGRRWQELGTLNREFIPSPDFPILSITVPTGTLLFPDTQSFPLLQKNGRMMT